MVEHRLEERRRERVEVEQRVEPGRRRPSRRCWRRCRPRRCACGPGRAGRARRASRRTSRSASTPDRSSAPRARTNRRRRRRSRRASRRGRPGTVTPLPAARPSRLTTTARAEPVEPRHRRIGLAGGEAGEAGAGDAEVGGESAGVALRCLQPGQLGRRPEARHATTGALVGDAGDQRRLGAGDDEIRLGLVGTRQLVGDGHLVAVLPARPGDRPLAPAAAEHQDHRSHRSAPVHSIGPKRPESSVDRDRRHARTPFEGEFGGGVRRRRWGSRR